MRNNAARNFAAVRSYTTVDFRRIKNNLKALLNHYGQKNRRQDRQKINAIAMVKANAYGHGLCEVSKALSKAVDVQGFGVATLEEGLALRNTGIQKQIWIVSGAAPLTEEIIQAGIKYDFELFIHNCDDLKNLLKYKSHSKKLKFHFKFNTGMNRLGLQFSEHLNLILQCQKERIRPVGVCTHFAMAHENGTGRNTITKKQIDEFSDIAKYFINSGVSQIHCANSAAIIMDYRLATSEFCNVIRPGIALYGYAGFKQDRVKLQPALKLYAKIILQRLLSQGQSIGYDCAYKTAKPLSQIVLAHGYADGFLRSLSNKEIKIALAGSSKLIKTEVLGRVSMDVVSIKGTKNDAEKVGRFVQLLGASQGQGMFMAEQAGTNIYEILTLCG